MIKHVERMGDQCVNIAKLVPLAGHEPPADERILADIQQHGRAGALSRSCSASRRSSAATSALAQDLVRQDDEIDRLNREVFQLALEIGDDPDTREWAMHMMLVARCIERIGDNAVDIGEQTAFVVTGLFREFEDASHPELAPPSDRLICACIDIGSNTTRLLVADAGDGQLRELVTQRAFTRIGKSLAASGSIPAEKIAETAEVVAHPGQAWRARSAPSRSSPWPRPRSATRPTATTLRERRARRRAACSSSVLSGEEEARLSFVGATRTLLQPADGTIAVIDVGGGSSEIAVGEPDGAMAWSASFRIGSGFLADSYLRSRPALGGRAREGAPPRGRHLRGPRAAAGARARWPWAAPPPRCAACWAPSSSHETLERGIRVLSHDPDRRGGRALRARPRARAPAAGGHPGARGDLGPARRCRCGSPAAACARACCSSWSRGGG